MISHYELKSGDIVLDAGCAFNYWAWHVVQLVGCRAVGIEVETGRALCAAAAAIRTLTRDEFLVSHKVAYLSEDLMDLTSLGEVTVVYMFDEVFVKPLMEHMLQLCSQSKYVRLIISVRQAVIQVTILYSITTVSMLDLRN